MKFIENITDKKTFLNFQGAKINPIVAENNLNQFMTMKEFFASDSFMLLVNGFLGVGKSTVVEHFTNFLTEETLVLKYNCYETTILDDMLLSFFEQFKKFISEGIIQEPKIRSENFVQKMNSYFYSISAPIVVVIDSFQDVLKGNKSEIFGFLKHLSSTGKVKVIMISRAFDLEDFEGNFEYKKITIQALEKSLYEKFLKSSNIKLIGPVSDELYKHTRGYFFYVALAIKIIQIRGLTLFEFLNGYGKSFLSYNDFILREGLALIDPVSGHLFRFLTLVRHPISIDLLKALNLYDEYKTKVFIETLVLSADENMLYLKDYYKKIAENLIPDNVATRIHKSCVELYNTQLPLKPMERNLLISRATMRSEIEYHSMFLPKKPVLKPKPESTITEQPSTPEVTQKPETKDIKNIRFIFDSEEEEADIMGKIADSINEFITISDQQLEEIERDNNMTLVELMNLALQEENKFNYKRVIMIYHRALTMKNNPDYQTFLPKIHSKLATAYARLSDWFNALKYNEEALKIYTSAGDMFKQAEIKLQIAGIYFEMYKRPQAREILESVIAMPNLPSETYIKTFIALAELIDNDIEVTYGLLKAALNYAENLDNQALLAELYYKYAIASDDAGETKEAVLYYKNCVEIEERNNPYLSGAYSNLASIYEEANAKDSAIKFYEISISIDEKNGNKNGIYQTSMKLAGLYRRTDTKKALEFYEKAYQTACALNELFYKISSTMATGDFYLYEKDYSNALKKYTFAKELAQGKMSEKNIQKIDRRIKDLKIQLGEEKFKEIGITDETK